MRYVRIGVVVGVLTLGGSMTSFVTAECGPPSEEEMTATQKAMFAEADADKSNSLSLDEFATFTKLFEAARAQRHFSCLDANSDGQVSAEELAAHRPPHRWHRPPPL